MDDIARAADAGQHRPGLRAAEVVEAGLGQQGLQRFPIAGLQALADCGGADGFAVCLLAGHNDAFDARLGQLLTHDLIVKARHLTGRLFAHIAGGDVQGRRDFGKHRQIQPGVAVDDSGFVLQEIAGEGGVGDDIRAAVVEHDVGQMGHPCLHQPFAHRKGHEAGILADHEEVEGIAGSRSFFHEVLVAEGEGVGIHDEGRALSPGLCLFECAQIGPEAVPAVLHKDEGVLHPGDLIEAEVAEESCAFHLGV